MGRVYLDTKNTIGVRTLSGLDGLEGFDASFRAPAEPAPRAAQNPVTLGAIIMSPGISDPGIYNMIRAGVFSANGNSRTGVTNTLLPAIPRPTPIIAFPTAPTDGYAITQPPSIPQPTPVIVSSPVNAAQPAPVSTQQTPTPTVTLSPAQTQAQTPPLVTSGGGTVSAGTNSYTTDASGNIINVQTGAIVLTAAQAAAAGLTASAMTVSNMTPATAASVASNSPATATTSATTSSDVTTQIATWLSGSTSIGSYSVPNALLAGAVVLGFAWLSSGSSGSGKKR